MKKAASLDDYERREWLTDLATRLAALLRQLTADGVADEHLSGLEEVVHTIEAGPDVERIWDSVLRALEEFAAGAGGRGRKRG